MKKTLIVLLASLLTFCGTLSAATNYVTKSEMKRIENAMNAYVAHSEKYVKQTSNAASLDAGVAATKEILRAIENDEAIKDAPPELKKYFDSIHAGMKQALKFLQNAPNWKGSEAEWQAELNKIGESVSAKEKEMANYALSCKVKKWRLPIFAYILIGAVVIGGLNRVFKLGKNKKNT